MSAVSPFVRPPVRPLRGAPSPLLRLARRPVAAPLLANAHFVLSNPVVLTALSGMAATAVWAAPERPLPARTRGKATPEWGRLAQACAAAAVPVLALAAVKVGLGQLHLGSDPAEVGAAVLRGTLGAWLAGVHVAVAGVALAVDHQVLDADRAPGALVAAASVAAPMASVAYAVALHYGLRWAPGAPAAVMSACYGAALGRHLGVAAADSLRAARAPAWCASHVLQSATWLGAAGGAAAALALWRV